MTVAGSPSTGWAFHSSRDGCCICRYIFIRVGALMTNAIESVKFSCRKLIKARGSFPNDEAAIKLLYLGLRNISQRWTMPIQNWKQAMSQFMIRFEKQFN